MKKKFLPKLIPAVMSMALLVITTAGFLTAFSLGGCGKTKYCDTDHPLYCSSAEKCCPSSNPYNDGHGTCFSTMSACRSTGYACEVCHEE